MTPQEIKDLIAQNSDPRFEKGMYDGKLDLILNAIVDLATNKGANINLSVSPSVVFTGTSTQVDITAISGQEASYISIAKGGTVLAESSGLLCEYSDTIEEESESFINYVASFIIDGDMREVHATVSVVNPIYYGAGDEYTDASQSAEPKKTPNGTYNVEVSADDSYIWFNIPANMSITGASMGGFEFPLEEPQLVTIDGVSYKSYRSTNTYDSGNYSILIF